MPMKPWPDEVMHSPPMWTSISSQSEFVGDRPGRLGVVGGEVLDRLVGEYDSPAERDPLRVALEHLDFVSGIAKLHRNGEAEPRRAAADAGDLHAVVTAQGLRCGRSCHRGAD